jgi:DNA-binding response OmpR family regulator
MQSQRLVVEDDENLRVSITGSLRGAGFAVDAAGDLPQADEALAVNAYDCAVRLPSGDGAALRAAAPAERSTASARCSPSRPRNSASWNTWWPSRVPR